MQHLLPYYFLITFAYFISLAPLLQLPYSNANQLRYHTQQQLDDPLRTARFPIVHSNSQSTQSFKTLHAGTPGHNPLLPASTTNVLLRGSASAPTHFRKTFNERRHSNPRSNHKSQPKQRVQDDTTMAPATKTQQLKEGASNKKPTAEKAVLHRSKKNKDDKSSSGWTETILREAAKLNNAAAAVTFSKDVATTATKHKKKSSSKNKENAPTTMETERTNTPTTSNRVSVGNSNAKKTQPTSPKDLPRDDVVYTTLIISPPKTKASKRIEAYVGMLKYLFAIIQSVDEDIEIYHYDETAKENITSDMTLFGRSTTTFPTTLTTMKKFFAGLHVRDTNKLYLNIRIGTNKDVYDVVSSGNALLQDAIDPDVPVSCNANWYTKHLQVPYAEDCGWIVGLFYNCSSADIENIIEHHLRKYRHDNKTLKVDLKISIRAKNVRQAPTTSKKNDNKKQNDMSSRTFHVEVPKGMKRTASRFIHKILKESPSVKKYSNLDFTWVPTIDKESSPSDISYSRAALAHHKCLLSSCEFSYVPGIEDLNVTSARLGGQSLREIILGLTLPSDDTRKIFMIVTTGYNGEALFYFAKKWASEARMVIKYLLLFLRRKYNKAGNAVEKGFTVEAIAEAEDHIWDNEKDCPTSKEAQELEQDLGHSKEKNADWIIEGMHLLSNNNHDDDDEDDDTSRPSKKAKGPAWENSSFVSRGIQRDDATNTSASEVTNLSDTDSNAGDEGPPANQG